MPVGVLCNTRIQELYVELHHLLTSVSACGTNVAAKPLPDCFLSRPSCQHRCCFTHLLLLDVDSCELQLLYQVSLQRQPHHPLPLSSLHQHRPWQVTDKSCCLVAGPNGHPNRHPWLSSRAQVRATSSTTAMPSSPSSLSSKRLRTSFAVRMTETFLWYVCTWPKAHHFIRMWAQHRKCSRS